MEVGIRNSYNHTLIACYIGYVTQAIINNFAPLLFLTFQRSYQISLDRITMLVSINFAVQLLVDLLSARYVDRIGYRSAIVGGHAFSAAGLVGLALLPDCFPDPYAGLLIAIALYAVGGGIIEVLVSPIVEACPTERKAAAMSLLHSFYCWGHVFVILVSTLFFATAGIGNWKILACLWALIPLGNLFYFALVPIAVLVEEKKGLKIGELCRTPLFWLLVVLMICSGASEQGMSQWASAFAEAGLGVSKTLGDLAGPCFFAVMMGLARVMYATFSSRLNLQGFMLGSSVLCIVCYLLAAVSPWPLPALIGCGVCGFSVGILWPGTFSIAAKECPLGGTAMFAFLALAGDLGCAAGPAVVGTVSGFFQDNLKMGLAAAVVFPVLMIAGLLRNRRWSKNRGGDRVEA